MFNSLNLSNSNSVRPHRKQSAESSQQLSINCGVAFRSVGRRADALHVHEHKHELHRSRGRTGAAQPRGEQHVLHGLQERNGFQAARKVSRSTCGTCIPLSRARRRGVTSSQQPAARLTFVCRLRPFAHGSKLGWSTIRPPTTSSHWRPNACSPPTRVSTATTKSDNFRPRNQRRGRRVATTGTTTRCALLVAGCWLLAAGC